MSAALATAIVIGTPSAFSRTHAIFLSRTDFMQQAIT